MTEPLSAARPDFFGKDSFTPFIGTVEDVDDPKHSGRVKVRCVGWHPRARKKGGEDSLTTDDLPWARVGMPTTHAQQSRIGGKHGLLPGCWVFGFFLDGDEAQDPFVLSSFNFTSKTSDTDNRKDVVGLTGSISEQGDGFDKVLNSPATQPNTALRTTEEQGQKGFANSSDAAGDNVNNDSDNPLCGGKAVLESAASKAAKEEARVPSNPVGQQYNTTIADGKCGSNPHQTEDIQLKLRERLPSEFDRFVYGDLVWERFQGNFMDLNGILAQVAIEICSLMKQNVEARKAEKEEAAFRATKPGELVAVPGRDPGKRIATDDKQRRESDIFHVGVASLIDQLCSIIMSLLQQQNNSGRDSDADDNRGGNRGADPNTNILNPGAECVADTFINNFMVVTNLGIDEAALQAVQKVKDAAESDGDDGTGDTLDAVLNVVGMVMKFGSGMSFPLIEKYAEKTNIFNSQGDKTQDESTREGCKQSRQYNTMRGAAGALGFLTAIQGAAASNTQGGSVSFNADVRNLWATGNVAGRRSPLLSEVDFTTCEEGKDDSDKPNGVNADVSAISLPSGEEEAAKNFVDGTPNVVVVENPGSGYYYDNVLYPNDAFPEIYIPGYNGVPTPVVNTESGEIVAIITVPEAWNPDYPMAPVSILPGTSNEGIPSNSPDFDIEIGGFYVQNTGFNYCNPVIRLYDRDAETYENGEASLILKEGRVVDVEVINSGTGFKSIPKVEITDDGTKCGTQGGYGAKIYPIMNVIPKIDSKESRLSVPITRVIYCPAKNQVNTVSVYRDPSAMAVNIVTNAISQI